MDLQKMEELSNLRKEGKISIVEFEERMKALRYESAQEGNSDVKKSPFLNRVKRENEYFEWRRLVKLHPVCLALRYSPIFLLLCFIVILTIWGNVITPEVMYRSIVGFVLYCVFVPFLLPIIAFKRVKDKKKIYFFYHYLMCFLEVLVVILWISSQQNRFK